MNRRRLIEVGLLAAAMGLLPACRSASSTRTPATGPAAASTTTQPAPVGKASAGKPDPAVPPPPGVDPKLVAARAEDTRAKANARLAEIIATLPKPDFLLPPATQPAPAPAPGNGNAAPGNAAPPVEFDAIPLAAQKAYMNGRRAFRERRPADAIRELQAAERLAPNHPDILKMLGQVFHAIGNKVKGNEYFAQAAASNPSDPESLVALGRFAGEQGRTLQAIAIFAHAVTLEGKAPDADAGIWPLLRYALAGALEQEGYDAACAEEYRRTLATLAGGVRTTRMGRELAFLMRQRGAMWQAIGDASLRLDDPAAALDAYQKAADPALNPAPATASTAGETRDPALVARFVYAELRLGRRAAAESRAVAFIRSAGGHPLALELARYMAARGSDPRKLAATLEKIYQETGRPAPLAIAVADLLGPEKGLTFLRAHLQANPKDRAALEKAIALAVADQPDGPPPVVRAARITAEVIKLAPDQARESTGTFLATLGDKSGGDDDWNKLTAAERAQPAMRLLRAALLTKAGRLDEALDEFNLALKDDPASLPARLGAARLQVVRRQFDKAAETLKPIEDRADTEIVALRIRILSETGKAADAIPLIDAALAKDPSSTDLIIQKASLKLAAKDPAGAERVLLDALDTRPQAEPLYEALFDLYDSAQAPGDALQQWQRLMRRLLSAMPQSRIARLKRAEWHAVNQQTDQAESLLRGLVAENPRDYKAIEGLCELLDRTDRAAETVSLLEERIAKAPNDVQNLLLLRNHYQRTSDRKSLIRTTERILLLEPAGPARAQALGLLYLREGRHEEAVKVLREALAQPRVEEPRGLVSLLARALTKLGKPAEAEKEIRDALVRFPKSDAELTVQLSLHFERIGDKAKSEATMVEALKRHPDDPVVNNALGYAWADQNRNLRQALTMIQKSVDADPDNSAYLDSLGWAYYKLREFDKAVMWLKRSAAAPNGDYPVILNHLGDALFRAGDAKQAREAWQRAVTRLPQEDMEEDPELKVIAPQLQKKLEAVTQGRAPELAPAPGDGEKPVVDPPAAPVKAPAPENKPPDNGVRG